MPYIDPIRQRKYQREWKNRRRREWLHEHGPCHRCSTWKHLEIDHRERDSKITHRLWSWSRVRREQELVKCQVLCHACHRRKHSRDGSGHGPVHGTRRRYQAGCRCRRCLAGMRGYRRYQALWTWLFRHGVEPRPLVAILRACCGYTPWRRQDTRTPGLPSRNGGRGQARRRLVPRTP